LLVHRCTSVTTSSHRYFVVNNDVTNDNKISRILYTWLDDNWKERYVSILFRKSEHSSDVTEKSVGEAVGNLVWSLGHVAIFSGLEPPYCFRHQHYSLSCRSASKIKFERHGPSDGEMNKTTRLIKCSIECFIPFNTDRTSEKVTTL